MERPQPRRDRLETLGAVSQAISGTLEFGDLCGTIDTQVSGIMDATMFSLAIHRPERHTLWLPYVREAGKLFRDEEIPFGTNITSKVIEGGMPLYFRTHAAYQEYARSLGLPPVNVGEETGEAVVFVPLNTGSRTIGVLSVESKAVDAYGEEDLDTLSVIASQAAIAIENARLFAESQDSVRQMQALLRVAETMNSSLDLRSVLRSILKSMREVIPFAFAAILLPDYKSETLDIMDSINLSGPADSMEGPAPALKIPFGQGISGAVFESGKALIVPDVRQFPRFVEHNLEGVLSEMAVPLIHGDRIVGVLDIGREGVDAFRQSEVQLLSLFASQAAIAIENARLFSEQQRRVEELQTIQHIVQKLTPLHELDEITAVIVNQLRDLIDYHTCRIYLIDETREALIPLRYTDARLPTSGLPLGRGIAGWIADTGQSALVDNTLEDDRAVHIMGTPLRVESMIGAPLIFEDSVRGVITLSTLGTHRFDENDLRLLEIIAAQAALALDRARIYEELRAEATTDPLVRLPNRRYLLERFRRERARAIRSGRPLAVMMMDIDKFKQVNDTFGHDAGDVVLQELAEIIQGQIRAEDVVARWGGEEFCMVLPETDIAQAAQIGMRLAEAIRTHILPVGAGMRHVTASIGVTMWAPPYGGDEMFSRADAAMYRVKAGGGNGVCVAEDGELRMVEEESA